MSNASAKQIRRGVRVVVGAEVQDALADQAEDLLRVRLILHRGLFGRLKWLLFGR